MTTGSITINARTAPLLSCMTHQKQGSFKHIRQAGRERQSWGWIEQVAEVTAIEVLWLAEYAKQLNTSKHKALSPRIAQPCLEGWVGFERAKLQRTMKGYANPGINCQHYHWTCWQLWIVVETATITDNNRSTHQHATLTIVISMDSLGCKQYHINSTQLCHVSIQ